MPLDIEQPLELVQYLRLAGHIGVEDEPAVEILRGGVSNRAVLVRRASGEAWVLKQALPKLRVATDWYSSPARIEREALGLKWLARLLPSGAAPELVFEDPANHLLAMTAVPEPHANWKTLLLAGTLEFRHVREFARLLGLLHGRGFAYREEIARDFGDRSFFESLRLEPYYDYTARQVPAAAAFLQALIAETRVLRLTLVHGDYSPKNILIYQDRLVLLDHEVMHFGDPGFDIGFALTHFLSKAHHLAEGRRDFADAASLFYGAYLETLGAVSWRAMLAPRVVRHALGCLLARVAGRSPLEYLGEREQARQRDAVLELMRAPPGTIAGLIAGFTAALDRH